MTTFTWLPDQGAERDITPQISIVNFGDGYEQRLAKGINFLPQLWKLNFTNRSAAYGQAIDAFLMGLQGIQPFLWVPPGATSALVFKCDLANYTYVVQSGGFVSIQATFTQVFDL